MRKNLKETCQRAGMTQKQVAEHLGVTIQTCRQMEKGTTERRKCLKLNNRNNPIESALSVTAFAIALISLFLSIMRYL